MEPDHVGTEVAAVKFEQHDLAAGLQLLDIGDQCHGWNACSKVAVSR